MDTPDKLYVGYNLRFKLGNCFVVSVDDGDAAVGGAYDHTAASADYGDDNDVDGDG
jgi:hypothetical protein